MATTNRPDAHPGFHSFDTESLTLDSQVFSSGALTRFIPPDTASNSKALKSKALHYHLCALMLDAANKVEENVLAAEVTTTAVACTDSRTKSTDSDVLSQEVTQMANVTATWTPGSTSTTEANLTAGPGHILTEDCRCGCIPNIMSLFQMAALRAERKTARKKAEAEAASKVKETEEAAN